ncbi:MAG: hypothetical protein SGPRY_013782, partial [Prymnesium sp.]
RWYGGLSTPQLTLITNSPTTGEQSARHELAHTLADLGEEYDGLEGGEDYSGANFAASRRVCGGGERARRVGDRLVWQCIPWGRWLQESDGSRSSSSSSRGSEGGDTSSGGSGGGGGSVARAREDHLTGGGKDDGAGAGSRSGSASSTSSSTGNGVSRNCTGSSSSGAGSCSNESLQQSEISLRLEASASSSKLLLAEYPWKELRWEHRSDGRGKGKEWDGVVYERAFTGSGGWDILRLSWSLAGTPSSSGISILIDDHPVDWQPQPHSDRQFFRYERRLSPSPAPHLLRVLVDHTLPRRESGQPPALLCHLMVHALSALSSNPGGVAAYPLRDGRGKLIGYRPTQVTHCRACSVHVMQVCREDVMHVV